MTRPEFNNQVHQLSRKLYIIAFRLLKRQDEAEDAVQEVFIRLWNRKDDLEGLNSIEAFATTTIKNYCIDILRKSSKITIEEESNHHNLHDQEPSPVEAMEKTEAGLILDGIIRRLPELYRSVIIMKEIDGLSYEEIVMITGQNINSLRVNLSRARKMIRDEYKKYKHEYTGSIKSADKVL